jgi:primosomal protein N'
MYVTLVIPLVRGIPIDVLSYFSATCYPIGTIVTIPVRGKTIQGVVGESKPVSSTKTALKAATFSLRKLPLQTTTTHISDTVLRTVDALYQITPYKRGALLFALLPPDIRSGLAPYPNLTSVVGNEDSTPQILSGPHAERFISYQSVIRSAFAHRGSVLLIVPSSSAVIAAYNALERGITKRVVCFSSHQSKRERTAAYTAYADLSHATLTIATPSFAYLDRPDCTTIIIDQAASPHYVMRERPGLDHREILKLLANTARRAIILGDILTRTEDEHKRREDSYQTHGEHPKRLGLPATLTVINQTDKPTPESPFQLFSSAAIKRIQISLDGRHNVFLFAARRGLAPVVACFDCGYIFRCPDSGTPYSLLRTQTSNGVEERWFISSTSGRRIRAADTCAVCGSWRLRERGIGIQQVEDECRKLFPQVPLTLFDHTTATTHKRSVALIENFTAHKGAILLGTQMIMPYFPATIDLSVIVSLDAVRSIPSWRADETLFRLILELREQSEREVIIQTRSETDDLLIYAGLGAAHRFHDDEIALRKMLKYPPFATFIFLSWQGSQAVIIETENLIKRILVPTGVLGQYYTNPHSTTRDPLRHCLLRLTPPSDLTLIMNQLRTLPPHITITLNPDRIV